MLDRIKDIWAHQKLAMMAFLVVLCLGGLFGVRTVTQIIYWSDPAKADQPLQPWMTPRYVGRSYGVPPQVVEQAFAMTADGHPPRISLETIALAHGTTLDAMQARLDAAVAQWRAANGVTNDE